MQPITQFKYFQAGPFYSSTFFCLCLAGTDARSAQPSDGRHLEYCLCSAWAGARWAQPPDSRLLLHCLCSETDARGTSQSDSRHLEYRLCLAGTDARRAPPSDSRDLEYPLCLAGTDARRAPPLDGQSEGEGVGHQFSHGSCGEISQGNALLWQFSSFFLLIIACVRQGRRGVENRLNQ